MIIYKVSKGTNILAGLYYGACGQTLDNVETGQFGCAVIDTVLALSRKGSGIHEKLRPCMTKFIAMKEYYDICVKHHLISDCYSNDFS